MTQPTKRSWHWFIIESEHDSFGIGDMLDGVLRDATGAAIYKITPMNEEAQPPTVPPVIVPPPIPAPLWRGTAIGDGYSIRDEHGAAVGATKAGEPLAVYAENVKAGEYSNRVVITAPGVVPSRNVWREGVRKA